ncbi:N-acetylneuraminate synthase [Chromobacterium sp. ASV23]|uniref:N-acetylneuraminate synthase n=1 Tax=Chromobacterium sp. ASV23 TaxID=2795110 RepID=UPI0018EA3769|nr:N-acetylneuraminate synthase [Chromobacterium sp. ASV23]
MIFGSQNSVFIIAEAGVNHNGDREMAFRLVDAAVSAGADAVKFQTFKTEKLVSRAAPKAAYQSKQTGAESSQYEMLKQLELSHDLHHELRSYCIERGIQFLSTAFDEGSLDFLCEMDMPFFKVPSGELTNLPLLWKFAHTGKPLVVSTGMATLSEVEAALATICHAVNHETEPTSLSDVWRAWSTQEARVRLSERVVLLHCTSQYPTPMHEVNLRSMKTLGEAFGLRIGYSDHTAGTLIPTAAVALGAVVIEKHFTLDRALPGPDHAASLEPEELAEMVASIRSLEVALGSAVKAPNDSEWDTRLAVRKQVVAAKPIKIGQPIERDDLTTARTGAGLGAEQLWDLVGTTAKQDLNVGDNL